MFRIELLATTGPSASLRSFGRVLSTARQAFSARISRVAVESINVIDESTRSLIVFIRRDATRYRSPNQHNSIGCRANDRQSGQNRFVSQCGGRKATADLSAVLLMNGPVKRRRIPPIRQRKGEWMGHGAFVGDPALVHLWRNSLKASRDAQDDKGIRCSSDDRQTGR